MNPASATRDVPLKRSSRPVVPTRAEVDALMKRCQIGVGGRHALDNAHDIMAECYGTLGALMLTVEAMRTALSVAHGALGECSPCAAVDCQAVQREWIDEARAGLERVLRPNVPA